MAAVVGGAIIDRRAMTEGVASAMGAGQVVQHVLKSTISHSKNHEHKLNDYFVILGEILDLRRTARLSDGLSVVQATVHSHLLQRRFCFKYSMLIGQFSFDCQLYVQLTSTWAVGCQLGCLSVSLLRHTAVISRSRISPYIYEGPSQRFVS